MVRVTGNGSLEKRGQGLWRLEVRAVDDDPEAETRYIKHRRSFRGNKREAQRALEQFRYEIEHADEVAAKEEAERLAKEEAERKRRTLGDYADEWHAYRKANAGLSPSTIDQEGRQISRLKNYLGDTPLSEVTASDIRAMYARMHEDGHSDDAVQRVHKLAKHIFADAVEDEVISRSPITKRRVPTPSVERGERQFLDLANIGRLHRILADEGDTQPEIMGVRLGLATGMRIGEVLGLVWGDVDLEGQSVSIKRQSTRYGDREKLKTGHSERRIAIDGDTSAHLHSWKRTQALRLQSLGLEQTDATPIVNNNKGAHYDPNNYRRWFRRFCARYGFGAFYDSDGNEVAVTEYATAVKRGKGSVRTNGNGLDGEGRPYSRVNPKPTVKKKLHYEGLTFHGLRHTQATAMLSQGTDVKTVQTRLGHAKAATTLDMYAHALPENDQKAAEMFGRLMTGPGGAEGAMPIAS